MNPFLPLLSLQATAAYITIAGFLVVLGVVVFIMATSSKSGDNSNAKDHVYKFRRTYFWGILSLMVILTFVTLRSLPFHEYQKEAPDEEVSIVAYQWGWRMANGPFDADVEDFDGPSTITVSVNNDIQFNVTAFDVNHNFAVYNSDGAVVTQVQAMPGYVNKLRYTFNEPGDYTVLCLEYCGISHAFMVGTIHVE